MTMTKRAVTILALMILVIHPSAAQGPWIFSALGNFLTRQPWRSSSSSTITRTTSSSSYTPITSSPNFQGLTLSTNPHPIVSSSIDLFEEQLQGSLLENPSGTLPDKIAVTETMFFTETVTAVEEKTVRVTTTVTRTKPGTTVVLTMPGTTVISTAQPEITTLPAETVTKTVTSTLPGITVVSTLSAKCPACLITDESEQAAYLAFKNSQNKPAGKLDEDVSVTTGTVTQLLKRTAEIESSSSESF